MFRPTDIVRTLTRWLAAPVGWLTDGPPRHSPPPDHRFRPMVNPMEDRYCPADLWYRGGMTNAFGDPAAWSTSRTAYTPPTDPPGPLDNTYFDGAVSNTMCAVVGTTAPYRPTPTAVGSINVVNGYAGSINFPGAFTVGTLTLDSGQATINQGSASADLTVTSAFTWTGGTLNGNTALANVILSGATALIAPTDAGMVTTGSNISLENSAAGTITEGTVAFKNGAGINVLTSSTLVIAPQNRGLRFERVDPNGVDGRLYIESGATIEVYRPDPDVPADDFVSSLPVDNDGGKFWIHGRITADISGEVFSTGSSVHQTGSTSVLLLENGSTLKVQNDFTLGGGKFSTVPVGSTYLQSEATINGNMTMTAGIVELDDPAYDPNHGSHIFGQLRVMGNLSWTGGVYRPHTRLEADGTTYRADLWIIDVIATVTNAGADGALLGPAPPENPGNYDLTGVGWTVMQAPTIRLTDEQGSWSLGWELPEQGNDWRNGRSILPTDQPNTIFITHTSP